jgi:NTE family protein
MFGGLYQRAIRVGRVVACAALVVGCTQTIHNDPINQQLTANPAQVEAELTPDVQTNYDDMVVALSFSGGGMRAAAFSYGVLQGFNETTVPTRSGPVSLLDRLDFLSGVSGGSVLAAYYGLRGREALGDSAISRADCKAASTTRPGSRFGSTRICTIMRRSRIC